MRKSKPILMLTALLFSFLCFPVKQTFAATSMAEVPLTVKQSFVVKNPVKEMDFTGNYEFRASRCETLARNCCTSLTRTGTNLDGSTDHNDSGSPSSSTPADTASG